MHHADIRADMRMRVIFAWASMRCPAGVADADPARKRFGSETKLQIFELAARPPPGQPARFQSRDPSGIIAAIFEALQRIENGAGDRVSELIAIPGLIAQALKCESAVEILAREIAKVRDVLYLGRGTSYRVEGGSRGQPYRRLRHDRRLQDGGTCWPRRQHRLAVLAAV
jgi:hypothetical protein